MKENGPSQFFDAAINMKSAPRGFDDPAYVPPQGHDREMRTGERDAITNGFVAAHKRRLKIKPANALIGTPFVEGM